MLRNSLSTFKARQPAQRMYALAARGVATLDHSTDIKQIQTNYMINTTRVCLNMPKHGNTWFFISRDQPVHEFIEEAKAEDKEVKEIEVLSGSINEAEPISDQITMFSLLEDSSKPLFLKINNIFY